MSITKRIIPLITALLILLSLLMIPFLYVNAAENETDAIIKKYKFRSPTTNYEYDPPKKITQSGKTYKFKRITKYETQSVDRYESKVEAFENLASKTVPLKKTYNINGKEVVMKVDSDNVIYTDNKGYTKATYKSRNVPKTKDIVVDGSRYLGRLKDVDTKQATEPFSITGRFVGQKGATYYFKNYVIKLGKGSAPVWDGYESLLISNFNLPAGSKITSARWVTGFIKEGKQTVRYANFNGIKPGQKYVATYAYETYNAIATYENNYPQDEEEYTVIANALYEYEQPPKEPGINWEKVVAVGASILAVALLIILALYIMSKKRKEKE